MSAAIYFCRSGESLQSVAEATPKLFTQPLSFADRLALVTKTNPHVAGMSIVSGDDLLLLGDEASLCTCSNDFQQFRSKYQLLPPATREGLREIGENNAIPLLIAAQQLMDDLRPQYSQAQHYIHQVTDPLRKNDLGILGNSWDLTNKLGSIAGGITESVGNQLSLLSRQMHLIESTLQHYNRATGEQKQMLMQTAKKLHLHMQKTFNGLLHNYQQRAMPGVANNPVHSFNRVRQLARQGVAMPYTGGMRAQNFFRAANTLRYVGRGLLVLDIGLRVSNVMTAAPEQAQRTLFKEVGGFGASFIGALGATKIALGLALGPVGWIIVILAIGVAV